MGENMNNNKYEFKYKNNRFFKKISPLFLILYILIIIVLYREIFLLYLFIPAIIACGILILVWMYFVKKKACITKGSFEFFDDEFYYTTYRKTMAIRYKEVDSITETEYIDRFLIFKKKIKQYEVKIINAGTFYFPYYDTSTEKAINLLRNKISEKTSR